MKHTLAQNKQLFNVKAIADSATLDALADGEFGVYAEGSDTSLPAATVFAGLPERFRFVSKLEGKVYYSFDVINKSSLSKVAEQAYQAAAVNIWEGIVASSECDCISTATIRIGLDEESLMRERGLSWVNTDSSVVSSPTELTAACDCSGNPVYDNMIITNELALQVNNSDSPFYLARVKYDVTGLPVYADQAALDVANAAPDEGDIGVVTADGLKVYNGTAWVVVGAVTGILTDVTAFIAATKVLNTDSDPLTDTGMLVLIVEAKPATVRNYKDLDVNYIFPRGVKLTPAVKVNGDAGPAIEFTETQEIVYELGAGADFRAEEFDCMSLYTNLNHYPQLSDGIAGEDLIYQFANGVNYNAVNFEFATNKVNSNDGDKRSFAVLLGTDDGGVFTALKALMGA